jgi:histone H3/H4
MSSSSGEVTVGSMLKEINKIKGDEVESVDGGDPDYEESVKSDITMTEIDSDEPYSEYTDSDEGSVLESDDEGSDGSDDEGSDDEGSDDEDESNDDKALKEIRYYQSTTHNLLNRTVFRRLCREVIQDFKTDINVEKQAFEALQCAAEDFLVEKFQQGQLCAIHAKRTILQPKDIQLARYLSQ